jgi:Lipase (class 3)
MLTPQQIAVVLCQAIYDYPGQAPITWDAETKLGSEAPVYWRMKVIDGIPRWVFRGSSNIPDWLNDLKRLAIPTRDRETGLVHPGFLAGMDAALGEMRATGAPLTGSYIQGHSLGAGHAGIATAKLVSRGIKPAGRIVFGEPRPGMRQMCDLAAQIPGWSYENAKPNGCEFEHDLVTDVPFRIPLVFPYGRPTPKIRVYGAPTDPDEWGPFRYHHIELYGRALNAP